MTTHSVLRLFIILAFMSAILFLHQMATLDRLERQPAFEVVHFQRTAFNKEQVDRYERSFQRAVGAYDDARNLDRNSGIITVIPHPLSRIGI